VRQQPGDQCKTDSLWFGKIVSQWEYLDNLLDFFFKVSVLLQFMEGYQGTRRKIRLADTFVNYKRGWDYL